jgi:hypothetical protein
MLQLYTDTAVILGITRENVNRLIDGKPIYLTIPAHKQINQIAIVFGETKPIILVALAKSGADVPQAYFDAAERDPL